MTLIAETASFADTIPKLLLINAVRRGSRAAVRERRRRRWRTWSWEATLEEVRTFAIGLTELGVHRDDRIAIIGHNRARLYFAMCAAQSVGAIPVPLDPDADAVRTAELLAHAGAKIAVVDDQRQIEKLISVAERLPALSHIVHDKPHGLTDHDRSLLTSFEEVQVLGRAAGARPSRPSWEREIGVGKGADIAVILYAPGADGEPKGVMLTYANAIMTARNAAVFDKIGEGEKVLAFVPMAWVADHVFCYAQSYVAGFCIHCPEGPETVLRNRRAIDVTYMVGPPKAYEDLLALTMARMEKAVLPRRRIFRSLIGIARQWGEQIRRRQRAPFHARLLYWLGRVLIYRPLLRRLGFKRVRIACAAGGTVGLETLRLYRSLGINLKRRYGPAEACAYVAQHPEGESHDDTVGRPLPGVEVRIADDGKIMCRAPGVFAGYFKNPAGTAAARTPEGWLYTGDAGALDPKTGHLRISGRTGECSRSGEGARFAAR